MDRRQEHFRLIHAQRPDEPAALVGPRDPVGLIVQFGADMPAEVLRDVRDELWSWCTPQPEDPWFAVDLWYHLAEYALDESAAGEVRWQLVPRHGKPDSEPPFVEDVTALYRAWMRCLDIGASGPRSASRQQQEARAAFIRDYVTLFALVGGEPRQTVGRLARLVRLQTGEDPTAKYAVRITGPASDVTIRVGHIEDFDFADAWACMPYEGLVVTKLSRGEAEPLGWKRGEVRALLRYIDAALASEMPCAGLVAEADGPSVTVSLRDETA